MFFRLPRNVDFETQRFSGQKTAGVATITRTLQQRVHYLSFQCLYPSLNNDFVIKIKNETGWLIRFLPFEFLSSSSFYRNVSKIWFL